MFSSSSFVLGTIGHASGGSDTTTYFLSDLSSIFNIETWDMQLNTIIKK